jgi:hypothetical protein
MGRLSDRVRVIEELEIALVPISQVSLVVPSEPLIPSESPLGSSKGFSDQQKVTPRRNEFGDDGGLSRHKLEKS